MKKFIALSILPLVVILALVFVPTDTKAGDIATNQDSFIEFEHVASLPLTGYPFNQEVIDNYVFVAASSSGVHIVDVNDLEHPTLLSTYDTPSSAYDVAVQDDVMYIADYEGGLHIVDITDPENPTYLSSYDLPGIAWEIVIQDDVAYVGNFDGGSYILDVADPTAPVLMNPDKLIPGMTVGIQVVDDLLYAASVHPALIIMDVSDLSSPSVVGDYFSPDTFMDDAWALKVVGDLAYVANGYEGLYIIDVSDPTDPERLSIFDTPGRVTGVDVQDKIAYVVDSTADQLMALDVSNSVHPIPKGMYGVKAFDVKVVDDIVFVTENNGLLILRVKKSPAIRTYLPMMIQ